ncbi:hypothetical protein [Roseibium sp.]|uniref:hypothetical protein n=1 Tax=Roseibium sp. TaxID=1936156 RepID=UPI003D0A1AE6
MRENIRDTFTPSRVGVLSWAFAAIVMGSIGMASYKFGSSTSGFSPAGTRVASLPLPPAGDVGSTASIRSYTSPNAVEVLHMPAQSASPEPPTLDQSQISVLQDQIARLRRRLSTMSEQNDGYSRRIAALESELSRPVAAIPAQETHTSSTTASFMKDPAVPDLADASDIKRPMAPLPKPHATKNTQTAALEAPASADQQNERRPPSRRIAINSGQATPAFEPPFTSQAPVKIVQLPSAETTPITTGSIPQADTLLPQEDFDSTPSGTSLRPKIIEPSDGVGTLRGGGSSTLKRSDFGAIVGHYASLAEAANAWSKFREQNEERMQDLRPLIKERSAEGGVSLLVGPFGNAADAAAACYYLLDVTNVCQPALYTGAPMVSAADFPQQTF